MRFLDSQERARVAVQKVNVVQRVGLLNARLVISEIPGEAVMGGKLVIDSPGEKVLAALLQGRHKVLPGLSAHRNIGRGPEGEIRSDIGIRRAARGCRRYFVQLGSCQRLPQTLIVEGPESLVRDDRSAHRSPKLIASKRGLVWRAGGTYVEIVARIQGTVAQELVDAAVELVSPRAGNGIDYAAGGSAVFR